MQYDQRENRGKFQPNVNYNVPILQLPQRKEINRPDIAYGSGSGLKLSDNSTDIAKAAQAAREEEYNQGLNDYARKVNEIAEGQRQGNYDVSTAEMYTRQLDDQYLRNGFYAKDLYKIRNQYDGGVRKIEEERQQQMVKHEQERRLKYLDTFRQEYNMPTATDEEIEALTSNIDNLMKATKMYQSYASRSDLTQDEREAYMAVAGIHGKQLDAVQGVLTLYGIVNDPKFNREDLTPQLKETLMKQMRNTLHDKIGVGFREANMIADKVMEESGLGYAFSKELKDLNASNEFIKTGVEQMMNTTKYGMLKDNPDLRAAMILGEGLTTFAAGEKAQFLINAVNGISRYTEGLTPDIDPNTAVEASNLIFNNQHQPTKILDYTFQNTANIVEKTIQDPKTLDRSALDIQLKNINGALEYVNDKSKLARLSKDVPVQEIADKLVYYKAATEGAQFAINNPELQRDMNALMDSFQAGRLSIDESGGIRLNKETTDKMSWLGDALGYEGTRQQIERINTAMEGMSAPARAAALEQMSGGRLRAVGMNEKLVNTTNPTLRGQVKNWLTQAGTDIMAGVTGDYRAETRKEYMDKAEQAVNTLLPNLQGEERDAAIKEVYDLVNPDRIANSVHKQNMSEEDYKKWYHDTNVKGLQEIMQKHSMFTDDIPLEYSSEVSNTSTIGGVSLVPQENMSAQALRQYADRLEASIASVERTGAKTEKGKLENDRKLIEAARAKADELEGVVRITSKVSNKSTIGNASLVNDDREMAVLPEADDLVVVDENSTRFTDEENRKDFNRWFADKLEKGEISPEDRGVDYDYVGYFNDPETDKSATSKTHFTDKYKKPNHDTFSNESIYATGENKKYAGRWEGDDYVPTKEKMYKLVEKIGKIRLEMEELPASSKERKNLAKYVKELEEYVDNYVKYSARERLHAAAVANGRPE